MSETPLANDASARDSAGTIVDQAGTGLTETTTPSTTEVVTESTTVSPASTTETKPAEGETLLTSDDKKPNADAKAPEKYADFKLPEGIKLDGEQLTAATALFKESGLSQDAAQKMVDFHVAQLKAAADAPAKAYSEMREKWQTEAKADPAIGPKMEQVKQNVGKLYAAIGDAKLVDDFKGLMNLTGVGDNPAFIKVLNKLSEFVVEGKHVAGAGPSAHGQSNTGREQKPTAAQALYPNLPSSARQ